MINTGVQETLYCLPVYIPGGGWSHYTASGVLAVAAAAAASPNLIRIHSGTFLPLNQRQTAYQNTKYCWNMLL